MTPCAAFEALDMLEPLLFFLQLELFFIGATICKMSHIMAFEAHKMREPLFLLLLHLSPSFSFALGHALFVEADATLGVILPQCAQPSNW